MSSRASPSLLFVTLLCWSVLIVIRSKHLLSSHMSSPGKVKGGNGHNSPRPTRPTHWYALPVGWFCRDDRGGIWGWLQLSVCFEKWFTVAYSTSGTVAAYILLASLGTQLGWYFKFTLLGRRSHKISYQELPFTKVLQTFWVGAVVCPVAVNVVRAGVGSMIAFVPGLLTVARPTTSMLDGTLTQYGLPTYEHTAAQAKENEVGCTGLTVAFVIAYFSAGLAEELAKVRRNFHSKCWPENSTLRTFTSTFPTCLFHSNRISDLQGTILRG